MNPTVSCLRRVSAAGGLLGCVLLLAGACGAGEQASGSDAVALVGATGARPSIELPELSGVVPSVVGQIRVAHSRLLEKRADDDVAPAALGNAYGELGVVLMAAEYHDVAALCLRSAAVLMPDAIRWPYYLGHLHTLRGELIEAAGFFARAHELRPRDLPTMVRLGEAWLDQGRPGDAEEVFERALRVEPASGAALAGLGRAALAGNDTERAVTFLERALTVDERASSLRYPLATAYRRLGELDRAEAQLKLRGRGTMVLSDPLMEEFAAVLESTVAYEARGLRALQQGQLAAAEDLFRRGLALAPNDPALRHRLGTVLMMAGDQRRAVEEFEETIRRTPDFSKAYFGLGMIETINRRPERAAERFLAALGYQPDYLEARVGLADALRMSGRPDESLDHYREVVVADPQFADAWMGYALALADLGRFNEARVRLTEARSVLPDHPQLGQLLTQLSSGP